MTGPDRNGEDLATVPTEPAVDGPQSLDDPVPADRDPDSPGAAISDERPGNAPGEVPQPNEPA